MTPLHRRNAECATQAVRRCSCSDGLAYDGRTDSEQMKPFERVQLVKVQSGQSHRGQAGRPVVSLAFRWATGGGEASKDRAELIDGARPFDCS
jgi:hypothetical protein